ncbi:ATP-binding cassette domain-containing protein [Dasania sp. GY-MA-18]|uniref:ATP-binding cassette domain-containing protein n=1 Tax=Dasania phycosphaerae TaxID=2950436 RepID=A0A9J6RQT9_9GAMM|nr:MULTISPECIES: ATP-binding cassette domain-containing protein [Dasania]MCR8924387.1 ATP-binding cassette domain-containing protein [Dasania sp. GY-MA-18]MCZ0867062.1 ATP-binding cassette domain-containing protein [Dasania phycosphaerae]MCZ0870514.1 ATP-binding cassette domain-containing protein [Dasania phycosphaerae]
MSKPILFQLQDFYAAYKTEPVLADLNWQWQAGQQWAVLGNNGAGKSALADALSLKLKALKGHYQHAEQLDPKHDIVQLSFELHKQLIAHDKRYDNSNEREDAFDIGTRVDNFILQGQPACPRFQQLVQRCHISHILDHGIRYISTGESRKVMLAKALYNQPKVLIIDNPFEGLDAQSQQDLQSLLDEVLRSAIHVMLLLQSPERIPPAISHIMVLAQGRIQQQGNREQMLSQQHASHADHKQSLPALPPAAKRNYHIDSSQALFDLQQVNVSYHEQAILTDINWQLQPGQHCHISGPNGAGKSTLLSMICGDNHKAYGQNISLFGRKRGSGESIWEIKQKFGLVNTQLQLNHVSRMRVTEVVASGLFDTVGLYDNCAGKQKDIVMQWLHYIGLDHLAKTRFEQLSFGQQRLVLLARAMVKSPLILILDEPCLGLDHSHRQQILRIVDHIAHSGRSHILYVSHEAEQIPRCINQQLQLAPHPNGGYTASVNDITHT